MKFEWMTDIVEGYTEEMDKKVAEKIGESFVSKADFNAANEAKKALEAQIKDRDKDIMELRKAAGNNEELSQKYAALQEKYKADTESLNKAMMDNKKQSAVDMAILQAKGRNPKAIKALLDMDKITLKDDGTLEGLDLDGLRKSDSYLFDVETTKVEGTGSPKSGVAEKSQGALDSFISAARSAAGLK